MFITLEQAKKHLLVDFEDDDRYIVDLIAVSEDAIANHLDCQLEDLVNEDGNLPAAINHAILLLVGNLYANREPVSYSQAVKVPFTFEYLVGLYKHYEIK